jgi:hypothetical protein
MILDKIRSNYQDSLVPAVNELKKSLQPSQMNQISYWISLPYRTIMAVTYLLMKLPASVLNFLSGARNNRTRAPTKSLSVNGAESPEHKVHIKMPGSKERASASDTALDLAAGYHHNEKPPTLDVDGQTLVKPAWQMPVHDSRTPHGRKDSSSLTEHSSSIDPCGAETRDSAPKVPARMLSNREELRAHDAEHDMADADAGMHSMREPHDVDMFMNAVVTGQSKSSEHTTQNRLEAPHGSRDVGSPRSSHAYQDGANSNSASQRRLETRRSPSGAVGSRSCYLHVPDANGYVGADSNEPERRSSMFSGEGGLRQAQSGGVMTGAESASRRQSDANKDSSGACSPPSNQSYGLEKANSPSQRRFEVHRGLSFNGWDGSPSDGSSASDRTTVLGGFHQRSDCGRLKGVAGMHECDKSTQQPWLQ